MRLTIKQTPAGTPNMIIYYTILLISSSRYDFFYWIQLSFNLHISISALQQRISRMKGYYEHTYIQDICYIDLFLILSSIS